MEYVYAAMLLHSGGKEISEANVEAVLKAAKYKVDSAKVKALVASIKNVNIDEAIEKAAVAPAAAGPAQAEAKEEKSEEEEKKSEEEAAAGLGALFG